MNTRTTRLTVASAVAIVLAACTSTPTRMDELETARAAVERVESSPVAGEYAAEEVTHAHEALREADRLAAAKGSRTDIVQMAYMAKRHADIAAEQIARGEAEKKSGMAESERQQVMSQAREREAELARTQAERAKADAELATQGAERTAEEARLKAAMLEQQLADLQAKQTDRGLVLTLGDVLFDTGQATLKPGAMSTVDRLSEFLAQSPDRAVTIEGHTDNVGSDSYNMSLSENRANALKAALVTKGIPADRIVALGKGEGSPVAGNDTAGGRQQNRRVEIIISNAPAVAGR